MLTGKDGVVGFTNVGTGMAATVTEYHPSRRGE